MKVSGENSREGFGWTWGMTLGLWLAFMLLTGGSTQPDTLVVVLHFAFAVALGACGLWRLRNGLPSRFAFVGWMLAATGLLLMALQTVPLPPSLWSHFPGRDLIRDTLLLTGGELPWLPLSLVPQATGAGLVHALPLVAGFVAALSLRSRDIAGLSGFIVLAALASVIIALLQTSGRAPDWLFFHGKPDVISASGVFANRNFLAAQVVASLPFLAVLATSVQRRHTIATVAVLLFTLVYMAIMLTGLAVAGSRAGVLLAMPSVLLTLLFVYKFPTDTSQARRSGLAVFATVGGLLVISQASMLGILRLVEHDPLADYRTTIYSVSWAAAKAFWPVGSGFGSFVDAYQMHEVPSAIIDRYVNAAHNDWLQLLIEGGAGVAMLMVVFVLMYLWAIVRAIKFNLHADEYSVAVRAGMLSVFLLACHALVDFGLQTPALACFFAVCCGLFCLSGRYETGRWQRREQPTESLPQMRPAPRTKPYFKVQPPQ